MSPLPPSLRLPRSHSPLLLTRTVADRQLVVAVSEEAASLGIRRGMTLTQARALHADVSHAEHEPVRDQLALEALGRWMMRFSPVVSCGTGALAVKGKRQKTGAAARAAEEEEEFQAGSLFLDVTGCERVFGGFENIVTQLSDSLARLGIAAHVAVAPTPGAAWALAYSGRHGSIIEEHQIESALDPLPTAGLRIGRELSLALAHLGLHTIGQVMHLPREVLPARFGDTLLRRVDQALGRIAEPLVPLQYRTTVEAQMDFEGSLQSLEAIWSVFQNLIGVVIEQLVRRGQGARRVDVELLRLHDAPISKTILLSRPSRDPVNLFNLFRCALEELELPLRERPRSRLRGRSPGKPPPRQVVKDSQIADDGFSGLRIRVPLCERLSEEQISLLGHEQYAGQIELDRLIERLRVRLGNEAVAGVELVEAYLPEGAWRNSNDEIRMTNEIRSSNDRMTKQRQDPRRSRLGSLIPFRHSSFDHSDIDSSFEFRHSNFPIRPLHLLPTPLPLRVMVTPSEDAEGRPAAFTHEGTVRQVAHCVGPERIGGRWWSGNDKTRDYFDVADPTGRRFWIFRVSETGRWYLHGNFE